MPKRRYVYVVTREFYHDNSEILGLYSSLNKAEAAHVSGNKRHLFKRGGMSWSAHAVSFRKDYNDCEVVIFKYEML